MRSRWLVMLVCGFAMGAGVVLLADPGGGSSSASATGIAPITGTSTGIAPIGQNAPGQPHNHDELAELVPDKRLTATERATLADQLTRARAVAMRYPTVADAVAAGYKRAGGFAPGAGAHYIAGYALSGPGVVDVEHPLALIYDGVSPTSKIAGLMYYGITRKQPLGFAGPNDHWHRHNAVCVKYTAVGIETPLPADAEVTAQQCAKAGGSFMRQTGWMLHAWVVPGYESRAGVFSHDNPGLLCADGTANTNTVGFCRGT